VPGGFFIGTARPHLSDCAITDAGLVHLEGLPNLKQLDLYGTRVTAAGLKRLREKLPGCEIDADVD
jgi:hypothetical protein